MLTTRNISTDERDVTMKQLRTLAIIAALAVLTQQSLEKLGVIEDRVGALHAVCDSR